MKPTIFIGSSTEGLRVAYAIQENLEPVADVTVWPQSVFQLSRSTLDSLLLILGESEFGIFVFTPDDMVAIRDEARPTVRDNVLFELGLFVGRLGPDRSFVVMPRDEPMHIPTDLLGMTPARYTAARADGNLTAALGPACTQIGNHLRVAPPKADLRDKDQIDHAWRDLLRAASRSVRILAGDASWARRDVDLLRELIAKGIDVAVLCEDPGPHIRVRQNLTLLLHAGVDVRLYSRNTGVRGIVVDWGTDSPGAALRVLKIPTTLHQHHEGEPGNAALFDYRAWQYSPNDKTPDIVVMADLFESLFASGQEALRLEPVHLASKEIADLLNVVDIHQYSEVRPEDLQIVSLTLDELWSCCRFVKLPRLQRVADLVKAYDSHGVPAFSPVVALSRRAHTLLLPPIVEWHEDKYVVVDGMHRLYTKLVLQKEGQTQCLVVATESPLPSRPLHFSDVVITPRKRPKTENFPELEMRYFRTVKQLEPVLQNWVRERAVGSEI